MCKHILQQITQNAKLIKNAHENPVTNFNAVGMAREKVSDCTEPSSSNLYSLKQRYSVNKAKPKQ